MRITEMTAPRSFLEVFAAAMSALVIASLGMLLALQIQIPLGYGTFIAGSATWSGGVKAQDLMAAPAFIIPFVISFAMQLYVLRWSEERFGQHFAKEFVEQQVLWSLPAMAAIFAALTGGKLEVFPFVLSAFGAHFVTALAVFGVRNSQWLRSASGTVSPRTWGYIALGNVLVALLPFGIAMIVGRLGFSIPNPIGNAGWLSTLLLGIGLLSTLWVLVSFPHFLSNLVRSSLLVGQIGCALLFAGLYPAGLRQPDGTVEHFQTSPLLIVVVVVLVSASIVDVVRRDWKWRRMSSGDWSGLLSPLALFALVSISMFGNTRAPEISVDDYHFGEQLLGWWSYLKGALPYVDFAPQHGLLDNDFAGLLSFLLYDGTAGTIAETHKLTTVLLSLFACLAVHKVTGSLPVALAATILAPIRPGWFLLVLVACLWFSRALQANATWWLIVWALSVPIVILGLPGQGLVLLAASGVMAAYYAWQHIRAASSRAWFELGGALVLILLLVTLTPLSSMLVGAVRFVLENGPINQAAYGVPWSVSWGGGGKTWLFIETARMLWIAVPVVGFVVAMGLLGPVDRAVALPMLVCAAFALLLVPYAMGRVDPGSMSRAGATSALTVGLLLPIVLMSFRPAHMALIALLAVCTGAAIGSRAPSHSMLAWSILPEIGTKQLRDTASAGMPNLGRSYIDGKHWDRLSELNSLLNSRLGKGESYLDLTSRNAQYFYLDRRPTIATTAVYNMVSPAEQLRAVARLKAMPPRIVLLEGDNIVHDGGGVAFRSPILYQFVMDNYVPERDGRFVIGVPKGQNTLRSIHFEIRNLTDENWDRGVHRRDAALILNDQQLLASLSPGDTVKLSASDERTVSRVSIEGGSIWLTGDAIVPDALLGSKGVPSVRLNEQSAKTYHSALFEQALSKRDLEKLPVSWGRSEQTLSDNMKVVVSDMGQPTAHDLRLLQGRYAVSGPDPQVTYDVSQFGLSGRSAGILRLEFSCFGKTADPRLQVFWWGDDRNGPVEHVSIKFTADDGVMLVPLDANPRWAMLGNVKGLRVDLDNRDACSAIGVGTVSLHERKN
jgi:hypothetical protein